MKTIWKIKLKRDALGGGKIEVPKGSKFLSVQSQQGEDTAWFICDPSHPLETRYILWVGTGFGINEDLNLEYLGTTQETLSNGAVFVSHYFEWIRS